MLTGCIVALTAATCVFGQWSGVGSESFYWHNRYHGLLAMSAYGEYETECPKTFTRQTLQRQYPGNREDPFQVVAKWGPTPKYGSEGYVVRVPEMNKIVMVFKGIYGWQNFDAALVPYLGIGCDATCRVHAGALEAWREVQAATNDFQAIKDHQANLVWSSSGHGFGGAISQVAALDLKHRGLAFSAHTFGSPAVFNNATAARWNVLFEGDASQRTVANNDAVPTYVPLSAGYQHVLTGIHVFGQSSMYGQDFAVCEGWAEDPRCLGGNNEADHYFYYTDIGYCGHGGWSDSYDRSFNSRALASQQARYSATATGPVGTVDTNATPSPVPESASASDSNLVVVSDSVVDSVANTTGDLLIINSGSASDSASASASTSSGSDEHSSATVAGHGAVLLAVLTVVARCVT